MNQNNDRRIPKTKEEKEQFKANKILEKQKRKDKALLKNSNNNEDNLLKSVKKLSVSNNQETKSEPLRVRKASDMVSFQDSTEKNKININHEPIPYIRTEESKMPLYLRHLYYPDRRISALKYLESNSYNIHSEIQKYCVKVDSYQIRGSTLRCQEFLKALKSMIVDLPVRKDEDFSQVCSTAITNSIDFLNKCRPIPMTIRTAINYLKLNLSTLNERDPNKCREILNEWINQFLDERIDAAHESIKRITSNYIKNNLSILVYSYSQIVSKSILYAWSTLKNSNFLVTVVDTFPDYEGRKMIDFLKKHQIPYCRTSLSAIPTIMNKIDVVILGTVLVMSNGNILSCSGAVSIANIAKSYLKKVIVCAETFKFSMQNQSNSFDFNELAHPNLLINKICRESQNDQSSDDVECLGNWRESESNITVLFPMYDVIQGSLISGICCELGIIAPTTVSHVSRVKQPY